MSLSKSIQTCLGLGRDETLLLVTDTAMTLVRDELVKALRPISGELIIMTMKPRNNHGEELPLAVSKAMDASDVVIGATSKSMTHTEATRNAVRNGARVASMPGMALDMLTNGGMTADYGLVEKAAQEVAFILTNGERITIRSEAGTDLEALIQGRKGKADTGLLTEKGTYGNLPGGEAFIAPLEDSAEGVIAFDGPIASAGLEHPPILVEIKDGKALRTDQPELRKIFSTVENACVVAEMGIGVNPKAGVIGNILEDEKALGTAHVAFGNNLNFGGVNRSQIHMDGILLNPTVMVDGRILLDKGGLIINTG